MLDEFPNAKNVCYLNTGSEGLLPVRAVRALEEAARQKQKAQLLDDSQYYRLPERCRTLLGRMLHCHAENIALVPSTSYAMSMIAHALPLRSGDEVLVVEKDFPSNNFAWEPLRAGGVSIRSAPFQPDRDQTGRLIESITPATRVLSLSLVHFYTGFRYDLKIISDLCRRKNIFLIVDAIQAVGTIELNLQETPVDALCAAAHKWQLCPTGLGFLYVHPDLILQLSAPVSGWMHNKNASRFEEVDMFEYNPALTARRFEIGSAPVLLYSAYEQCLSLLLEARLPYIEQHNTGLADRMKDFFRELGWQQPETPLRTPFCSVLPPEQYNAVDLSNALSRQDVFVAVRANHLRMTPHLYNTEQHIDRFCAAFRSLIH